MKYFISKMELHHIDERTLNVRYESLASITLQTFYNRTSVNTFEVFTSQYLNTLFNFGQTSFMALYGVLWHMIIFWHSNFGNHKKCRLHGSLVLLICRSKNFMVFHFLPNEFCSERNLWESIQLQRMLSIQRPAPIHMFSFVEFAKIRALLSTLFMLCCS